MPRYLVSVCRTTEYEVEVDAPDRQAADESARQAVIPTDCETAVGANVIAQLGEPWVYGWARDNSDNAYYGRPDGYMETKDLLVFYRAPGNLFTKDDVALLIKRVCAAVGPVRSHWNGAGSTGLTIQLVEPPGRLSDAQVAVIMAPRETDNG